MNQKDKDWKMKVDQKTFSMIGKKFEEANKNLKKIISRNYSHEQLQAALREFKIQIKVRSLFIKAMQVDKREFIEQVKLLKNKINMSK